MKDKSNRKANIISIRMSDEEHEFIRKLMDSRNERASFIMREAFSLFREQWEISRHMESSIQN
jgi:predicted transcriptional regulator